MLKIKTVIGARPQFIKAAVLSKSFAKIDANQSTLFGKICDKSVHLFKISVCRVLIIRVLHIIRLCVLFLFVRWSSCG